MSSSDGSWISCCHRGDVLELGWSVDTGKGATFGPDLPLAEAVVTVAVADLTRIKLPACWGFLGHSALVAVYGVSRGRLP